MNDVVRILLAEDNENLGTLIESYLVAKGFNADLARDGKEALHKFNLGSYHFVILDVMMPEMDGFEVARRIREIDKKTPIIFLTAKTMKADKLEGFEVGADDYLTKPFSMEELIARIKAILKRTKEDDAPINDAYIIGKSLFDPQKRTIQIGENEIKLTTKESQLLKLLVKNKHQLLDRQAALRSIWGDDNYFNGRSMDVYIAKLRKLLKDDDSVEIMNIHGKGFKLLD